MKIQSIEELEKGKQKISFDSGEVLILYRKEVNTYRLEEEMQVSQELYQTLLYEVIGKRATKRAMHLLERQERTERQLREKLAGSQYPPEAIEQAVGYVKKYHYLDDFRYACTFVRCQKEKRSIQRMRQDLFRKGIADSVIEQAIAEEANEDETAAIRRLLEKKGYHEEMSREEAYKIYRFLLGKGYRSSDIRHVMGR